MSSEQRPTVGFIGLGAMGAPMVANLCRAGYDLKVASRSRGPIEAAVALGATATEDLAALARSVSVLCICVPTSSDVDQVVSDLLPGLGAGTIVLDCSTIDPEVERELHERVAATGARYLDAPLSGGTIGAEAGTLTVMVGGDAAVLDEVRPVLGAVASTVVHVGGPGMGQVVKLCNNLIYAAQMVAVSEAAALAVASGADLERLVEVIEASSGNCVALQTRFPVPGVLEHSPATKGWAPGFATRWMLKDLDLALAWAATQQVATAFTAHAKDFHRAAVDNGSGGEDFSSVAKVVFRRSNLPALEG